jgi:hypothetical protein
MSQSTPASLFDVALATSASGPLAVSQGPGALPLFDTNLSYSGGTLTQKAASMQTDPLHEWRSSDNTLRGEFHPLGQLKVTKDDSLISGLDVHGNMLGGAGFWNTRWFTDDYLIAYPGNPAWVHRTGIGNDGAIYTTAYQIISGHTNEVVGDGFRIIQGSPDHAMLHVWGDVIGPMFQTRGSGGAGSHHYSAISREANYVFQILDEGNLQWGEVALDGARDGNGIPVMDIDLGRQAAGVLECNAAFKARTLASVPTQAADHALEVLNYLSGDSLLIDGVGALTYYGNSFIVSSTSAVVQNAGRHEIASVSPGNYPLRVTGSFGSAYSSGTAFFSGATGEAGIHVANSGSGGRDYALLTTSSASGLGGGKFFLVDAGNGAPRWTMDTAGQFYINEINAGSAGAMLEVKSNGGSTPIHAGYDSGGALAYLFRANGAWQPPHLADSAVANDSVYYSTTASKLVYKDSGGVVNNFY